MEKKIVIKLDDKINITVIDSTKPFHKVYGNYEVMFDKHTEKLRLRKVILKDVWR